MRRIAPQRTYAMGLRLAALGWRLCENARWPGRYCSPALSCRRGWPLSSSRRRHQHRSADDRDCPFQVVGKDVKVHFGSDVGQPPCPEACLTAIEHNLTPEAFCYATRILRRIIRISSRTILPWLSAMQFRQNVKKSAGGAG